MCGCGCAVVGEGCWRSSTCLSPHVSAVSCVGVGARSWVKAAGGAATAEPPCECGVMCGVGARSWVKAGVCVGGSMHAQEAGWAGMCAGACSLARAQAQEPLLPAPPPLGNKACGDPLPASMPYSLPPLAPPPTHSPPPLHMQLSAPAPAPAQPGSRPGIPLGIECEATCSQLATYFPGVPRQELMGTLEAFQVRRGCAHMCGCWCWC